MVSSQKFLAKCDKLRERDVSFEMEQGGIIARGFADLGYEEFILLSANKISSLYSGKVSELPEEDKKHFFCVPEADEMVAKLIKGGKEIEKLEFVDGRSWSLIIRSGSSRGVFSAPHLKEVLIQALIGDADV